jgi:hypothetical protein
MKTKTATDTSDVPRLGKRQIDWAEWAIDPMTDYWTTDDEARVRDGAVISDADLPEIIGSTLRLSHCPDEVVEDLLYRLEDQAPDMIDQEMGEHAHADMRAVRSLADRIRTGTKLAWLREELDFHDIAYPSTTLAGILRELDDRQDADGDSEGYYPNTEMQILGDYEQKFGRVER